MDPPEYVPLKTKLRDHWNTRDQMLQVKPEKANWMGISFFWAFTLSCMFTSLWVIIPHLNRIDSERELWMQAFVWWIFVQTVVNWTLCVVIDTSVSRNVSTPAEFAGSVMQELPPGWWHCSICNMDVPPRASHCKLCKTCILKRDHHCFFTGFCVGFHNQRRFTVFCFYIVVGSLYGVILILDYLNDPLPINSSDGFTYIACVALWQWVFGSLATGHFLLILQMYFCLGTLIASGGFLFWQVGMAYRGQTTYESQRGIHRYRGDAMDNIRSVFGPYGLVHFILPLPIKQQGDGATWSTKSIKAN